MNFLPSSLRISSRPFRLLLAAVALPAFISSTQAQIVLELVESEGSTTITYSGALDAFVGFPLGGDITTEIRPSTQGFIHFPTSDIAFTTMARSGDFPWSSDDIGSIDGFATPGSSPLGFQGNFLFVEAGYVAGDPINGQISFAATTLQDLGMTGDTFGSFYMGANEFQWSATQLAAVPEPSSAAALAGLATLGFMLCRRPGRVHPARS